MSKKFNYSQHTLCKLLLLYFFQNVGDNGDDDSPYPGTPSLPDVFYPSGSPVSPQENCLSAHDNDNEGMSQMSLVV